MNKLLKYLLFTNNLKIKVNILLKILVIHAVSSDIHEYAGTEKQDAHEFSGCQASNAGHPLLRSQIVTSSDYILPRHMNWFNDT